MAELSPKFLAALHTRSRQNVQDRDIYILKHGHITTEELEETYGYDHPPRAARDVREQGIPLETFILKGAHRPFDSRV